MLDKLGHERIKVKRQLGISKRRANFNQKRFNTDSHPARCPALKSEKETASNHV